MAGEHRTNSSRVISTVLVLLLSMAATACTDPEEACCVDSILAPDHSVDVSAPKDLRPKDQPKSEDITLPTWWRPGPGTPWHWQLEGIIPVDLKVKMYDIDLYNNKAAFIATLKAKGFKVICYFSAGTYEKDRPDAGSFPAAVIGKKMKGWDEYWLDIRSTVVQGLMSKRLDLARSRGCDGVEPDNVDGFDNNTGFPLTYQDQAKYNRFLAQEAHKRGLSVGLKNDLKQVKDLLPYFDWALNEQCLQYKECYLLSPFIAAGKAVFHVEYSPGTTAAKVCPNIKALKFDSQIKKWLLDAWSEPCWK